MVTLGRFCGLVGFIGLFSILTASCATAKGPTGAPDDDGKLDVSAAALRFECTCMCNDGSLHAAAIYADHLGFAAITAGEQLGAICAPRGGIRNGTLDCKS